MRLVEIVVMFTTAVAAFSMGRVVGFWQGANWAADQMGLPKVEWSWREWFGRMWGRAP